MHMKGKVRSNDCNIAVSKRLLGHMEDGNAGRNRFLKLMTILAEERMRRRSLERSEQNLSTRTAHHRSTSLKSLQAQCLLPNRLKASDIDHFDHIRTIPSSTTKRPA